MLLAENGMLLSGEHNQTCASLFTSQSMGLYKEAMQLQLNIREYPLVI